MNRVLHPTRIRSLGDSGRSAQPASEHDLPPADLGVARVGPLLALHSGAARAAFAAAAAGLVASRISAPPLREVVRSVDTEAADEFRRFDRSNGHARRGGS